MALTKVITELTDLNQADSESGLRMPSGGSFSGTPVEGMMRNDTTQTSDGSASTMQHYNGSNWKNFVNVLLPIEIEYLCIAGGGAGGSWGGGGGAGGYLTNFGGTKSVLTAGATYTVTIGPGGVKQTATGTRTVANPGVNSSISGTGVSVTSTGGGGGGTMIWASNTTEYPGQTGGSGGGASSMRASGAGGSGTVGQGNDGGNNGGATSSNYPGGGGGGGAGAPGGNGQGDTGASAYQAGNGGNGLASSITGSLVTRAGGGSGFTYGDTVASVGTGGTGGGGAGGRFVSQVNGYNPAPSNAVNGTINTGSGGGSGSANPSGSGTNWYGGDTASGGSGVVILRILTSQYTGITAGLPTVDNSTVPGTTILIFNGSGSYTA